MQGKPPTWQGVGDGTEGASLFPGLVARRNASPQAVAAHQRARLHAAMIEACARNGYASTTVRELIALAGVSPNTLYRHFDGKEDCFLATFDLVLAEAIARIASAYAAEPQSGDRDWTAGLCRAIDAFVNELLLRPKASRLAVVEVLTVGAPGLKRIERAEVSFTQMIATSLARAPEPRPLPPLITRSLVGGIWFVARRRLREERMLALARCGRELLDWMLAYPAVATEELTATAPRIDWELGKSCLERFPSDPRSRMLRAAAELAAAHGFGALGEGGIAERAEVDPVDFAAEFEGVGDCFFAALEMLTAQALARALRESGQAEEWPAAVCGAVDSLLRQLAADPVLARVTFVASSEAGGAGREHCDALVEAFAGVFVRRAPKEHRPSALVAEAVIGAAWSILHRYVNSGRARHLPALGSPISYLALAPVLGPDEAVSRSRDYF
jgi:AcrR family transcriptional regulator